MQTIRPGQVVTFVYNKGSQPGSQRLVEVAEASSTHIKGEDLNAPDHDRYRNFLTSEIGANTLSVVADEHEEVIRPSDFIRKPDGLLPDDVMGIYKILNRQRKGIRYDDKAKVVVVRRTDLPRVDFVVEKDKTTIDFVNEEGKRLGLSFDHQQNGQPLRLVCRMDMSTLQQFAKQLASHVANPAVPGTKVDGWDNFVNQQAAKGTPLYAGVSTNA